MIVAIKYDKESDVFCLTVGDKQYVFDDSEFLWAFLEGALYDEAGVDQEEAAIE